MIGDKLVLQPYHIPPAKRIHSHLENELRNNSTLPYFITISGESGCGKSTLAIALKEVFSQSGVSSFIIHMDDYFHLPPTSNHLQRLKDINHVGPQEVDLKLLQKHIDMIKDGADEIIKPLIHYKENEKRTEILKANGIDLIIIEGTYVTLLEGIDTKMFMLRTFEETWEDRKKRGRDPLIPFLEEVLKIEHSIVKGHSAKASILIDKDYNVKII